MRPFRFSAERILDAPADVVYHCLTDYREHHNTRGFLPPTFTELEVLRGGVGAGTVFRFTTKVAGRSATRTQEVGEPEPGRVLVERGAGEGSRFTVEPHGGHTRVRIDTVLRARGLEGLLLHLFGARIFGPLYADELARLEQYARAHGPLPAASPDLSPEAGPPIAT
jgi:hypothetical protein